LVGPRIDREEVIVLLHEVPLMKENFGDRAGDLRAHADRLERLDVADRLNVHGNVALRDRCGDDRDRATFAATTSSAAPAAVAPRRRRASRRATARAGARDDQDDQKEKQ